MYYTMESLCSLQAVLCCDECAVPVHDNSLLPEGEGVCACVWRGGGKEGPQCRYCKFLYCGLGFVCELYNNGGAVPA